MEFIGFHKQIFDRVLDGQRIRWFDRKGTLELGEGLIGELVLDSNGQHDHMVGYLVRVVSKKAGLLSSTFFKFEDTMVAVPRMVTAGYIALQVILYCCNNGKCGWYIDVPTDESAENYAKKVMEYLAQWEE